MVDEISQEVLMDYQNRTVVSVSNPRWADAGHTLLDADVVFLELESLGAIPFTTTVNADTAHGVEIWTKANAGDYGTITEYVEPPPVIPDRVTARQFGLQLIALGLKSQVDAWIATQDASTQWAYEKSSTFVRTDEMMQNGFTALGFTPQQIDDFFLAASLL
jgi:hypothetical protein